MLVRVGPIIFFLNEVFGNDIFKDGETIYFCTRLPSAETCSGPAGPSPSGSPKSVSQKFKVDPTFRQKNTILLWRLLRSRPSWTTPPAASPLAGLSWPPGDWKKKTLTNFPLERFLRASSAWTTRISMGGGKIIEQFFRTLCTVVWYFYKKEWKQVKSFFYIFNNFYFSYLAFLHLSSLSHSCCPCRCSSSQANAPLMRGTMFKTAP